MNTVHHKIALLCISCIIFLFTFPAFSFDKKETETQGNVISDPITGKKIYADQMMLTLKQDITQKEKDVIFSQHGLKTISAAPTLGIYHISFANPDARLNKYEEKKKELQRNPKILYISTCKLYIDHDSSYYLVEDQKISRKGNIAVQATDDVIKQIKPKTVRETINQHSQSLYYCVEKKQRLLENYHGKITFRLKLADSGKIVSVKIIRSTVNDKNLFSCLKKKIFNWNDFPPRIKKSGYRTVEFAFSF